MIFYCTFGQRYRREPHPSGKAVDPDGWVAITAPDEESARAKMAEVYGMDWSWIYPADDFDESSFPAGCFARMSVEA